MSGYRVAVVGSGMAGMTAAYKLKAAGFEPTVFEREPRVGGRIWTVEQGGYIMDLGAAVYLGTYREAIETICTALTTKAISFRGKLKAIKLVTLLLRNLGNLGYSDYTKLEAIELESTRDYSQRELNRELEQYATEPLVRGTWAADDGESSNALMLWSIRNMLVPTVSASTPAWTRSPGPSPPRYPPASPTPSTTSPSTPAAWTSPTRRPPVPRRPRALTRRSSRPRPSRRWRCSPKAVGRAPAGKAMYTLLGSHEYLHRSWDRPDEELLQDAINCAQGYHGGDIAGELEEYKIVRWDEVVPVIDTGRFGVIAQFKRGVTNTSRVQLASDLDRIPGVNGALVSGIEAAARITTGSADWSTTVAMPASLAGS